AVPLPESHWEMEELLPEAKYYLIQGLLEECQTGYKTKKMLANPSARFLSSPPPRKNRNLQRLQISPAVKLLYNRSKKCSYTSRSEDNMLKNMKLFDKLSLRFNGQVLFIKDVIGGEICCWSFNGQSRKIAEVCCTFIVYATVKKQTKTDFPEARIYEGNILLCESQDSRGPDNEFLQATGGRLGTPITWTRMRSRKERIERVLRNHIKHSDDWPTSTSE
ncbi:BTB POZ domain-containing adapter for CUL3-mediated degradation 3 isoform X1, partial [Sigmodon hispidus]